jgi:hypothetical protein
LGALAFAAVIALGSAPSMARVWVGVGIGPYWGPGYYAPPPPYYYYPPPAYYPPPPTYYAPPPVAAAPPPAAPAAVQTAPACNQGQWRQADGSVVSGVACQQPDGTWKLNQ